MEIEFIPDRLNQEPVVYIGMTDSELKSLGLLSVIVCMPIGLLICALFGMAMMGIGLGAFMAYGAMWLMGKVLTKMKRNKPPRYHIMKLHAWLEDKGWRERTMIRQSITWEIRRTQSVKIR